MRESISMSKRGDGEKETENWKKDIAPVRKNDTMVDIPRVGADGGTWAHFWKWTPNSDDFTADPICTRKQISITLRYMSHDSDVLEWDWWQVNRSHLRQCVSWLSPVVSPKHHLSQLANQHVQAVSPGALRGHRAESGFLIPLTYKGSASCFAGHSKINLPVMQISHCSMSRSKKKIHFECLTVCFTCIKVQILDLICLIKSNNALHKKEM